MKSPVELWIEALRSGDYRQGKFALQTENGGYCCLGVACEVYQDVVGGLAIGRDDTGDATYDGENCFLPRAVQTWLGLTGRRATYQPEGALLDTLTSVNDGGASFDEIADLIESRPPKLFKDDK